MSPAAGIACPRCKALCPPPAPGIWVACDSCGHRWLPPASALPVSAPPSAPAPAAPPLPVPGAFPSDEYLPDDPQLELKTKALEVRKDGGASAMHPVVLPPAAPAEPARPRPPPREPERPTGPLDSNLFDRLEQDAQEQRAKLDTVPEIPAEAPGQAAPARDGRHKTTCPVCGHGFPAEGRDRQSCPQCGTAFDEASGKLTPGSADPGDPLIGRTLRGCLIDRKLGEGGMGSVYHARQLSLDRSVAIKVLPADLARNRNFIQRFEREAKSLARINHVNILHIYDFGEEPQLGLYFMVIEYVDGLDLGEILNRRGALNQIELLDLLRQSLSGLETAVEKGVIHRDLKPDNLMIAANGVVKVSDFGLAKGYGAEVGVTAVGVRVGTPAFMSPEQCDGADVDFRSDVYNLGCTAFLALTGRLPFDGETPFAIMLKHKTETVPSMLQYDGGIDQRVDRLVQRMLAKRPDDRCLNLRELIEEVESLEVELAGTDSVMRRSRGPFRALVAKATGGTEPEPSGGHPVLPAPRPPSPPAAQRQGTPIAAPPVRPSGRNPAVAPIPAPAPTASPDWLRLVDDLPKAPPPPVTAPAPVVEVSPRTPAPEAGKPPSRRLDLELGLARERGRRSELSTLVASAERLWATRRWDEAAGAWERAADLSSPEARPRLEEKARKARVRAGVRRLRRRVIFSVFGTVLAVLAVFALTPHVHNLLASWELSGLTAVPDPNPQIQARNLRAFAKTNRDPYLWYQMVFRRPYGVKAAGQAEQQADELERLPRRPPAPVPGREGPIPKIGIDTASLESALRNEQIPYQAVLEQAEAAARGGSSRAGEIAKAAKAEIEAMTREVDQANAARQAGRHQEALALAATFLGKRPRSGELALRLPQPAKLTIDSGGNPVDGLVVRVDGVNLAGFSGREGVFCRSVDKDTALEVLATGFLPVRLTIPASNDPRERTVSALLRLAPTWSRLLPAAAGSSWGVRLHALKGGLLGVHHRDGLALLRLDDGTVHAQAERLVMGSGLTTLWLGEGDRLLVGSGDGQLLALDPSSLVLQQTLYRSPQPVTATLDFPLSYQAGSRMRLVETDVAGAKTLVALRGAQEVWRYANLKGLHPVLLAHVEDRVMALDDSAVHLLDEDGSGARVTRLPSARIGPAVALPGRNTWLVPTTLGVQLLEIGSSEDPVRLVDERSLSTLGPSLAACDGDQVLVACADHSTALFKSGKDGLQRIWREPGDQLPVHLPVFGDGLVATADERGAVIRDRSSGKSLLRLQTAAPLAGPPLLIGRSLVLSDRSGEISAWVIGKR